MGSKGCDDVTVGYWYYVGMHMALCHGPVDFLLNIKVAGRCAWGGQQGQGTISIDNPELFGGEDREGGVVGDVDVMLGGPAQGQNAYLAEQLGAQPAYRQVASIVLNQVNIGLNPYPKTWQVRAQRIHTRQGGIAQWYDAKSAINAPVCPDMVCGTIEPPKSSDWRVHFSGAGGSIEIEGECSVFSTSTTHRLWVEDIKFFDRKGNLLNKWPWQSGDYCAASAGVPPHMCGKAFDNIIKFNDHWSSDKPGSEFLSFHFAGRDVSVAYFEMTSFNEGDVCRSRNRPVAFQLQYKNQEGEWITVGTYAVRPYGTHSQWSDATVFDTKTFYIYTNAEDPDYPLTEETIGVNPIDMNPAHIIRECLTDTDWGMGYPESDIDDVTFIACADTLYDDAMGMSLLWDKQLPLEDFVMEILKHINAVLYVSRLSGKFVLKLIRDDYDVNTILELNEDHIVSVSSAKRTSFGELVNSVTVQYWDTCTGEDASLTIADQALVSMQGNTINTTVQYPGFTHRAIASQVCLRDLRILSTPLLGCTVYANRHAADLNVGDVFVMRWPDLDIDGVIMRVVGMAYGDGRNNAVQIQCSEDVFGYPLVVVADDDPDDPKWEDPIRPPVPVVHQLAVESPYYELIQRLGETIVNDALADDPLLGYAGAACVQPGAAMKSNLYTDAGAGYAKRGSLPFCATATLTNSIAIRQTIFDYDTEIDIHHASVGEHAQIDGELVRIDAIDTTAKTLTVGRGVLDTCVRAHPAGARIFFWDADHGIDRTTYVDGESIDVKLLPVSGKGELQIADATAMQVTLAHRAIRPYPPADMQVDGVSYPSNAETTPVVITWAHRDRLQQTDGNLYDDTQAGIGPEANTEYLIQVFDDTDTEVINLPNIVGNTKSVDISALVDGESYEMHLSATRNGYESWQVNIWAFTKGAYIAAPPIFTGTIPGFSGVAMIVNYDCSPHFTTGGAVDSYSLQGAPAWLSIDNAGVMTGTADAEAVSNVTVTAHNADGTAVSNVFEVNSTEAAAGAVPHKYWRLDISANNGLSNWHSIHELKFMGVSGGDSLAVGGVASAHSEYAGGTGPPANAFDADPATRWVSANNSGSLPTWIQYEFVDPVDITHFSIYTEETTYLAAVPKDFCLQFSDDGVDWITIKCFTDETGWSTNEAREYKAFHIGTPVFDGSIENRNAPIGFIFKFDASIHFGTGGTPTEYSLQNAPSWMSIDNAGRITGTPTVEAVHSGITVTATQAGQGSAVSNAFDVTAEASLHKLYWRIHVTATQANDNYTSLAEVEMRGAIGGADQCNGGIATASSVYSGSPPESAVDGDPVSMWQSNASTPQWWQYEFTAPVSVAEIMIQGRSNHTFTRLPKDFTIEVSDNGSDWVTVAAFADEINWGQSEIRLFIL